MSAKRNTYSRCGAVKVVAEFKVGNKRYREANLAADRKKEISEHQHHWYLATHEKRLEYSRNYKEAHRAEIKARRAQWYLATYHFTSNM